MNLAKREKIMIETTISQKSGAYISILTAAILWGIIGLWNRQLMTIGLSPTTIVMVRNFGGMLLLTAIFLIRDRSVFRVKREHLKYFFGTGVISVVLFTCCYFTCQKLCSLALASILLYTAPSFVVVLSALLWNEPVTKKKTLALFLTLIGCALVCGIFARALTATLLGILLGLGSGFFYALYSIFAHYALNRYSSMTVTVWTFLFAGPVSLLLVRPAELAIAFSHAQTWLLAAALVVFSTVLPYIFYTRGLARIEAGNASIIASLEPVVASLAGIFLLGEPISGQSVAGIALVLAGVVILR